MAAALTVAVAGTAAAQTNPPAPPPQAPTAVVAGPTQSHWTAAGFVGSNFSTSVDDTDADTEAAFGFGGQMGYLWQGIVGIEGLADFAPSIDVAPALFADEPSVNSYMANAIGALPLGTEGQIQPYVSGGFGSMQLKGDVLRIVTAQPVDSTDGEDTIRTNESRWAGNIGGGLMGFANHFGFRTDVRYYRAMADDSLSEVTSADDLTGELLSGLSYWRANVGVALRW
jgi:hypothetical protein